MTRLTLALLALSLAAPLHAQGAGAAPNAAVSTIGGMWKQLTGYITAVAEESPEALYDYRPTPDVRSLGELIGHVAGAQYMICAAALGEAPRAENAVEESAKTKADLVAALKASTEYCGRAYAQTDAAASQAVSLFGQDGTRLWALTLNATHNGEHYGNLVTYLRINGIVPPSSRGGM